MGIVIPYKIGSNQKSLLETKRIIYIHKSFNTARWYNNYKHTHNNQFSKYIWSKNCKKLKGDIGSSTIIIGDIKTALSIMNRTIREKISKETEDLNNTINQLNLTNMYRTLYSMTTEHSSHVNMGHSPE